MSKVETPILDRMLEIQEQSQLCGDFLKWLESKYAMFELRTSREEPYYIGAGDYIDTEKLLAEYFGIDLVEAEKERNAIIEMEINKNKSHHCRCCGTYIEEESLKVCNKCSSEFQF